MIYIIIIIYMLNMDNQFKNLQLEKFQYNILYKDWLLMQILDNINTDIELLIRKQLYGMEKVRKFKSPSINELKKGLHQNNRDYVLINEDGIVFETTSYENYKEFLENDIIELSKVFINNVMQ